MGMGQTGMCFLASDMDLAKGNDRGEMMRELEQWGAEQEERFTSSEKRRKEVSSVPGVEDGRQDRGDRNEYKSTVHAHWLLLSQ